MKGVESGGAEGDGHDEHDTDDPGGQLAEKEEERNTACLGWRIAWVGAAPGCEQAGGADECQDACDSDGGNTGAYDEVFVGLAGEGAHPETGEEEVVRGDGNREDVDQLPAKKTGFEQPGRIDQGTIDVGFDANGYGGYDDETDYHGTLDVVCQE